MTEVHHRFNDGLLAQLRPVTEKRSIELEGRSRDGPEVFERRVARSEIIDVHSRAELPQLSDRPQRSVVIAQEVALRDFETYRARMQTGSRDDGRDMTGESSIAQLTG